MDLFNSWLVEKYIAHRGFHDNVIPENSLGAFANAIQKGYAIELDVQAISDNTVVVFHDNSLSRMTGKDGYVKNLTKKELKKCFLGDTNECIPTLEEVLKLVDGKVPLLIEIKNSNKVGELEKNVLEILNGYKGEFAIQSFNPYVLAYFKEHAPHILRGQLSGYFKGEKLEMIKKFALKRLLLSKVACPDFINYEAKYLPNRFVNHYKSLPLLAWCVKSQDEYMKLVKVCDNIVFEGFEPTI